MAYEPNAVADAARAISDLRQRFSADTCTEAWRRLGGLEAVKEWKRRTAPMPNVTIEISPDSLRAQIQSATRAIKEAGKQREFRVVDQAEGEAYPMPGCLCDFCKETRREPLASVLAANAAETYDAAMVGLVTNSAVEVIVRNLRTCRPEDVTAALKILASGGPSRRCAFCGTPEGGTHSTACPFSSYPAAPDPYVPFKPISTPGRVPSVTPQGRTAGLTYSPDGKPIGRAQVTSAAPKDSILNPPVKGFIGSDKYGYDPDVD